VAGESPAHALFAAVGGADGAPVAAYREQKVEIALRPKGIFENGNIGPLMAVCPPTGWSTPFPSRILHRRPPKAPKMPRVVEILRKAVEWQALLESGEAANQAAIARQPHFRFSDG